MGRGIARRFRRHASSSSSHLLRKYEPASALSPSPSPTLRRRAGEGKRGKIFSSSCDERSSWVLPRSRALRRYVPRAAVHPHTASASFPALNSRFIIPAVCWRQSMTRWPMDARLKIAGMTDQRRRAVRWPLGTAVRHSLASALNAAQRELLFLQMLDAVAQLGGALELELGDAASRISFLQRGDALRDVLERHVVLGLLRRRRRGRRSPPRPPRPSARRSPFESSAA